MKNKGRRWALGLLMLGLLGLENVSAAGSFYELKRSDVAFHAGAAFPVGKFGRAPFSSIDYGNRTLDCDGAKIGVTY
ncbi:MAG: hypothetical protein K2H65_06005, partial [Bacteroidales bacterium]|nr:hypothetical protein [Bacteroidales bacterium]